MLEQEDLKFNFGCASCGYKNRPEDQPLGTIPVARVIEKLDSLFACNNMTEAGRLLRYWRKEAVSLRDKRGELAMVSEQIGYFRKTGEEAEALEAVERALTLIDQTQESVSNGTILLNTATTLKAFGKAEQALPLYEKAYAIYKKHLAENDLLLAGYYNNYGLALADLERYEEAEDCYQKALQIVLQDEKGRLDGAVTYLNMAHMYPYWDEKSAADIKDCLNKAQQILQDPNQPQNGYYAFVLSKCAPSFRQFGKEDLAREMEQLSEEIYAGNSAGETVL